MQLFVQKTCLVPALGQEVLRLLHCPLAVSSHFIISLDDCFGSNFNSLNSRYKRSSIKIRIVEDSYSSVMRYTCFFVKKHSLKEMQLGC